MRLKDEFENYLVIHNGTNHYLRVSSYISVL